MTKWNPGSTTVDPFTPTAFHFKEILKNVNYMWWMIYIADKFLWSDALANTTYLHWCDKQILWQQRFTCLKPKRWEETTPGWREWEQVIERKQDPDVALI